MSTVRSNSTHRDGPPTKLDSKSRRQSAKSDNSIFGRIIDEILTNNIHNIECSFRCGLKEHEVLQEGFPICISFKSILSLNLHLNDDHKKAKQLVDDLRIEKDNFEKTLKDPQGFVFDYAADVKNKIDLERERLILEIHEISDEMIGKVKAFESKSNQYLKVIQQNEMKNEHEAYLNDLNEKLKSVDEGLRISKLAEAKLKKLIQEFKKIKQENDAKFQSYKSFLLNENEFGFEAANFKFNSNFFGDFFLGEFCKFSESKILEYKNQVESLLKLCEFDRNAKFELIYQASKDGFGSKSFHRKCDGQAKTLTIIKEKKKSYVFGGFTEIAWDSTSYGKKDENAFIFSLINKEHNPLKMKTKPDDSSSTILTLVLHSDMIFVLKAIQI